MWSTCTCICVWLYVSLHACMHTYKDLIFNLELLPQAFSSLFIEDVSLAKPRAFSFLLIKLVILPLRLLVSSLLVLEFQVVNRLNWVFNIFYGSEFWLPHSGGKYFICLGIFPSFALVFIEQYSISKCKACLDWKNSIFIFYFNKYIYDVY